MPSHDLIRRVAYLLHEGWVEWQRWQRIKLPYPGAEYFWLTAEQYLVSGPRG